MFRAMYIAVLVALVVLGVFLMLGRPDKWSSRLTFARPKEWLSPRTWPARWAEHEERQNLKRTMATMRLWKTIAEQAFERYAPATSDNWRQRDEILRRVLRARGRPFTRRAAEMVDAWGTPLAIHATAVGYEIRSAGADRRFDVRVPGGETDSSAEDLIIVNGSFEQYPPGSTADWRGRSRPVIVNCTQCHQGMPWLP